MTKEVKKPEAIEALPIMHRLAEITIKKRDASVDPDGDGDNDYEISLSSEFPVDRWFGNEVLDHSPGSVDMSRAAEGLPLLVDHDTGDQVGIIEGVSLGADKKLRGTMRFSRSVRAQEVKQDVDDGIRKNISLGYMVNEVKLDTQSADGPDTYRVTKWTPAEGSIVPVPADPTVGVGRSSEKTFPVKGFSTARSGRTQEAANMATEATAPAATGNNGGTAAATVVVAASIRNFQADAVEITKIAQRHGMSDMLSDFLTRGLTPDQVSAEILESKRNAVQSGAISVQDGSTLELNDKERKEYSYTRALQAALSIREGASVSGFEVDIAQDLAKRMPSTFGSKGGILVPLSMTSKRSALDSKTVNAAKELVFQEYGGEIIEILRNMTAAVRMGARVLSGLSSPVGFPRQTGDLAAYWVAENGGSDVTSSNISTDLVTLSPKTLQGTTAFSRQLLVQAVSSVEGMIRESIAAAHALAWDKAVIHGTGSSNQPTGIYNAAGVNGYAITGGSGVPSWVDVVKMMTAVAQANAFLGRLGWMTNPGLAGQMMTTLKSSVAGAQYLWDGTFEDGNIGGYTATATNQVRSDLGGGSNENGLIYGNWGDVLIGQFGGAVEIIVDPYALKKQGLIELTSFQMCDIAIRHGQSFTKATGALIV